MGIKLNAAESSPAVVYDRVFLTRLEIEQPISTVDGGQLKYSVVIEYRLYGADVHGVRHFQGAAHEVVIRDYLAAALAKAAAGDMDMLAALQAIEAAIASIIADSKGTTAEVVR